MIEFLVKRRAPVLLVVAIVLILGSSAYRRLPRESSPDVNVPFVMVSTPYPGVSPADVESLLTMPLESELSGLKALKRMSSVSAEGVSLITLEFEPEAEIGDALQRIRDRVSRARPNLPEDAEETDVREVSFSDFPILIVTLAGGVDDEELKVLAERLQDDLKRVSGVLDVKLSGGRTREIRVDVDPNRLRHYALSLEDVITAIRGENVNIPGGDVKAGNANFLVRVPGEVKRAEELLDVAVKRVGDRPVFVRDLANVEDSFADRTTYSRMNGEPSVSLAVTKRAGANILELAQQVKAKAAEHQARWPEGVRFRALGDQSKYVKDMVSELENNIMLALLLVVGVVFAFLGVRNSLFVALTIPLSMLMGVLVFSVLGTTLNMVVLFSLILVLGMLVDNAIVLVENIYRHVEKGSSLFRASIDGAREIAVAVSASTLTTVAAFVPLLFWTGIMGGFMVYLPQTVVIVLTASLLVSLLLLPPLTARFMAQAKPKPAAAPPHRVLAAYEWLLRRALRWPKLSAFNMTALLIFTFVIYGAFNHGTEFFPDTEPDQATITVRGADGMDVEATDRLVRQIEAIVSAEPNVEVYVAETGVSGGSDPMEGTQAAGNAARITLDFLPHPTKAHPGETPRSEDARETIERLREKVSALPGAKITVEKQRMGPPVGKPIVVEVAGPGFHETGELALKVRREISNIAGVTGLSDDYRVGRPEMQWRVDRGAAKRVGASTQAVAGAVRTAVAGSVASKLRDGDDEYDIVVRLAPQFRADLEAVGSLTVPGREDTSPETFAVPISSVATYALAGGSGAIRHIDQKLVVTISGDVVEGENENAVRARVVDYIQKASLPPGFQLRLGGADDEQRKSQEFLSQAFSIAIFLIALVLVGQFNRFDLPLLVLGSVVLSLIGVLWGLLLTGTAFGIIMTGLGVISLAGVVVNNAIVLLDYIEQLRAQGLGVDEALIEAGRTRFRPVMLTAGTTILGLVPMAMGIGIDFGTLTVQAGTQSGEWWGPMAVAVIFGLAFATLLTLVFIPTMYRLLENTRETLAALGARIRRRPLAVSPSEAE